MSKVAEGTAPTVPVDYDGLASEDVLYDRHRREYFVVGGLDDRGIDLRQDGTEFFVPHSLFVPWYGSRVFKATNLSNAELPDWVDGR